MYDNLFTSNVKIQKRKLIYNVNFRNLYFNLKSHYLDTPETLIFVHIGKCAGSTLWEAIKKSDDINEQFRYILKSHMHIPPILKKSKYVFCVRNPIYRALSAFNWRYKLVVEDNARKKFLFSNEHYILKKYGTFNKLAENLYDNNEINNQVEHELRSIYHLKNPIYYYLQPLLEQISNTQIYQVFHVEDLNLQVKNKLNVNLDFNLNDNSKINDNQKHLSVLAKSNLTKYFEKDFQIIDTLNQKLIS